MELKLVECDYCGTKEALYRYIFDVICCNDCFIRLQEEAHELEEKENNA